VDRIAGKTQLVAWSLLLVLISPMLLTATGCLGGSRNFVSAGSELASSGTARPAAPRVGSPAPDFELKDLDGKTVRLSDLKGKPVLINFWATWCPNCKEDMPGLEKAYQKYRDQGVVFLGVDQGESADTVRNFVKKNGYSWTFLLDSDMKVSMSYRASAIPMTFFIDREGVLQDIHIGPFIPSTLESKLAKIQ
jgi:cytochrome c biogenesis protein CcmG/thiol:disulfide interchange protein DsbE